MEPLKPHVIVLFGATGDLAQRKLLPGAAAPVGGGLVPECRIVGTALDDLDDEAFRDLARRSCEKFSSREISDDQWRRYADRLTFVPAAVRARPGWPRRWPTPSGPSAPTTTAGCTT